MPPIPDEVIHAVQEAVDIVEVISRHVTLKRAGASWKGLCPFHEEKSPSFHVFPQSRRYKCFGCGEGGSVFTFLMKKANLHFREAVSELAREAGIAVPEAGGGGGEDPTAGRRAAARRALDFAAGFFETVLGRPIGQPAREYLRARGIADATTREFRLGFAPDEREGLRGYARSKGIADEALFDAGLVRRRPEDGSVFDMFRGRITFPIHDAAGHVIGFGARAMGDAQPKYLNSPDGLLFHKGREMYGLHRARPDAVRAGRVLLVEGYTDVMLCHQAGVRGVVAALGTALTSENARALRRVGVPIVLVYDGDEAGQRAAERAADLLLADGIEGSVAVLPEGQDPADLVVAKGADALGAAVSGGVDLFEFRVRRATARHGDSSLDGRRKAVGEILETVSRMTDPLRRQMALKLLSERLGIPESTLRDALPKTRPAPASAPAAEPQAPADRWGKAEREFLSGALEDAAVWDRIEDVYPPASFRDGRLREVAEAFERLRRERGAVTRAALLGVLSDEGVRVLESLEATEGAAARALAHLDRIERETEMSRALSGPAPLEAALEARRRRRGPEARTEDA